ncbi:hypothetical protein ACFX19_044192 [Malus domestica]
MLLSFKDIRDNQYHVETTEDNSSEFLYITSYKYGQKHIHEKLERLPIGFYITTIRGKESHHMVGPVLGFHNTLLLWYPQIITWASFTSIRWIPSLQSLFFGEVECLTLNYKIIHSHLKFL